ncbi:OmpP1/FadL family transporter [Dechloromonas sp. HYN0024]|uniref:OmpP1/FadL family transporter n=1 Tax=Dechloromonas sp. HYN0024 TaxID=2231055 RepID=UPI000E42E2B7|nr:outer membrane protein transport protein [Dechloromonas sp. HYN0024]AXS78869.1 transporter [Dechloromonas sp. HYN0024]
MNKMILRTVPALLLLAFSGMASAGAFQLMEQNASGLGNAYAGSAAVADNASTIFYNPAGMTQLGNGIQLSVGVAGVGPSYEYRDTSGVKSGGDAGGWAAVPNAYLSGQLSKDLYLGLGISAPFGLATEYDAGWAGAGRALKSEIKTVNINPSLAYRVTDKVSLGFGLNYQTIEGELTKTGAILKADDTSWGWNAGALFTLSPAMRLGISYRSAIKYKLEGTLNGALPVNADVKLPDTFILSVWQQVSDRWEAMGDLSYTRWNSLQSLDVRRSSDGLLLSSEPFKYENSWRFAWGAGYKATDKAKLKFGIAFDRTPVRDEYRTARVPDNNRLWLSLGAQWNAGTYGKFDLGYSYLYVIDPSISQPATTVPVALPALQGKYDASAHIVGVQYSVGF